MEPPRESSQLCARELGFCLWLRCCLWLAFDLDFSSGLDFAIGWDVASGLDAGFSLYVAFGLGSAIAGIVLMRTEAEPWTGGIYNELYNGMCK